MITTYGELTAFAARLKNDGNHSVQLRFSIPIDPESENPELDDLRRYIGEYCDIGINPGYLSGDGGEEIELAGTLNGYKAKVTKDADYVEIGFIVARTYGQSLGRMVTHDVIAKSCRIEVELSQTPPLPGIDDEEGEDDG